MADPLHVELDLVDEGDGETTTVEKDGTAVGQLWHLRQNHKFRYHRSGTQRAWGVEMADGRREWVCTREEAIEWITDRVREDMCLT